MIGEIALLIEDYRATQTKQAERSPPTTAKGRPCAVRGINCAKADYSTAPPWIGFRRTPNMTQRVGANNTSGAMST